MKTSTLYKFVMMAYTKRLRKNIKRKNILKDAGYVLPIVLIICVILTALSSEFMIKSIKSAKISYTAKENSQAYFAAESGFRLAEMILDADKTGKSALLLKKNTDTAVDSYDDLWAYELPPFDIDGYSIKIKIEDEQSKINVNTVTNPFVFPTVFYKMVSRLFFDMGFENDFLDSLADYIDADESKSAYGCETYDFYSRFPVQGKSKNSDLDSINEIQMIKGFDWKIFHGIAGGNFGEEKYLVDSNFTRKTLSFDEENEEEKKEDYQKPEREKSRLMSMYLRATPYIDINDEKNKINVNTAPFRILYSIHEEMTDDKVAQIIDKRKKAPIKDLKELSGIITDSSLNKWLTVSSSLYCINITVEHSGRKIEARGIYDRNNKKYFYLKIN